MQRFDHKLAVLLVALTPLVGGCSDLGVPGVTVTPPKISRPDWLTYTGNTQEFSLRPATSADFVGPQGECPPNSALTPSPVDEGGLPLVQGGIALQMTECDVVRRAGVPDNIQVGRNERGEREAVLTYAGGPRPGIYRFAAGRLYTIERGPEPPPPPSATKKAAKKPARG